MRMHDHRMPCSGDFDLRQSISRGQHQPAEQHRSDVVAMPATAGDGFAGHGVRVQRVRIQRRVEQRVGGHQGGHAGRRRAAQPGAERDALVEFDLEAERQRQRFAQRKQRAAGGVALGLQRQVGDRAADRLDPHRRFVDAAHGGDIADAGDAVAEDVEADPHIAYGSRRKRPRFHACAHRRAPSAAASRSRSENTPAAVTSGPAPGPCTTSGLSR